MQIETTLVFAVSVLFNKKPDSFLSTPINFLLNDYNVDQTKPKAFAYEKVNVTKNLK